VFPALVPDTFSADYEIPAIKAVLEAFPNRTRYLGCAFHFRYSLDKQAQKHRLTRLFRTQTCAYVKVYQLSSNCSSGETKLLNLQKRLLFSLAYVPVDHLENYTRVVTDLITEPQLQNYTKYFCKTWVGNTRLHKPPTFRRDWWNLFERIKNGSATTNNYAESNNNRLAKLMGVRKPGLWRFMLRLQSTYDFYDQKQLEFVGGQTPKRQSSYEEKRAEAIKKAVDRFAQLTQKEYLYGLVKATSQ